MTTTLFADLFNGYNETLINGSTVAADNLLNAVGPELAAGLSLFVITNGTLVFLHRMQWNTTVLNCVRAVAVANLLTVALYNQWVQQMFLVRIPDWITGAVGAGGLEGVGIATQFDALRNAVNHQAADLLAANAGISPSLIANRMSISLAAEFSVGALWLSFLIDFVAQALMSIVAPVGAVVLLAYLFGNTRHWAERWIGKLVALSLLELLVAIELNIVLVQFRANMATVEAVSGTGADADELISNLWGVGWDFLFGAALMIALPAIAAAIGGSHVSNIVVTHVTMAGNAIGRLMASQATSRAASGAAAATARTARAAVDGNRSLGIE